MRFTVSLLENDSAIRNEILKAMQPIINKAITYTVNNIKPDIIKLIKEALETEPEYNSLVSGELRREFGIEDTSSVNTVVNALANSIVTESNLTIINNTGLSGGLSIKIINRNDYGGSLDTEAAKVVDGIRGYSLPWLEWLLLKGNQILVRNYSVKLGSNPYSRSGDAIMIPSNKNWRVPPEYAGTQQDNWTTRALLKIDKQLTSIIQNKFESAL